MDEQQTNPVQLRPWIPIRIENTRDGQWELWVDGEFKGTFSTPADAFQA